MPITFTGKGTPITAADVQSATTALGGDVASLWSLVGVETHGFGFLADRRPQILFERSVFADRTNGNYSQSNPDISNSERGGYVGGAAEYDRLARAMALDERAALESASWGLGQVMGHNAGKVGYADVYAMINAMVAGESAQLQAVANFITSNPASRTAFRDRDWAKVAFYYNGRDYAVKHYDLSLAKNYVVFSTSDNRPDIDLRTAQACLLYLGHLRRPTDVDGRIGPQTQAALLAYRETKGLPAGGLDADVLNRLRTEADI
jgi:N-acetylmuramidase